MIGVETVPEADPALLAFVAFIGRFLDGEGVPQFDRAGPVLVVREVLWRRLPNRVLPIASLTKMMTALVVVQRARPSDKVKVTKLDVDANIRTATRFNVRSIPMLLFFKDGKVVDQIVGAVPRQTIEAKFKQHAA